MTLLPFLTAQDVRAAAPRVAAHLRTTGVLGHPTETVYGLGGGTREADLDALFALKGRADDKPVLLLVSGRRMAEDYVAFPPAAAGIAAACWPGPLTLVLPAKASVPGRLRGASGGVGVRWTSHERIAELIAMLGHPITSTSANQPGGAPAARARDVESAFPGANLLVLDGGLLPDSAPSTVVDCTGPSPRVVREGALSLTDLRQRAGQWVP